MPIYSDWFGYSVSISDNGNALAVGAVGEKSADGAEGDNSARDAGAVYVFARDGATWKQQAYT